MLKPFTNNRGIVLITSICFVMIATLLAAGMIFLQQSFIQQIYVEQAHIRAKANAEGVMSWGVGILIQTVGEQIDTFAEFPTLQLANGFKIKGAIADAQSKFNINNLIDPAQAQIFIQILRQADPEVSAEQAKKITDRLVQWLLVPAHYPLSSLSELNIIPDLDFRSYQKIQPYLVALPEFTALNLTMAEPRLIKWIYPKVEDEDLKAWVVARKNTKNPTLLQKLVQTLTQKYPELSNSLMTRSDYFFITALIEKDKDDYLWVRLMKRDRANQKVTTIGQSQGMNAWTQ